jgi:hypothetical protein
MAERTPSPGNCTRNGTCLTHGSQVESRPSSASLSPISVSRVWYKLRSCWTRSFSARGRSKVTHHSRGWTSLRYAWGWIESVSLQHTVQTISSLRSLLHQSVAVRHQGTQLTHCLWRHPHRSNEIGRKPPGQVNRLTRVRLHPCSADQLDRLRMSDEHLCDQRVELIIQQPRIGSRFQHDGICMGYMDFRPRGPSPHNQSAQG